jgi:type III secretory pathway component EscT
MIVVAILVMHLVNATLSTEVAGLWYGVNGSVRAIALGLLIGTISAAVFWVVGIRGTELRRASSDPS